MDRYQLYMQKPKDEEWTVTRRPWKTSLVKICGLLPVGNKQCTSADAQGNL